MASSNSKARKAVRGVRADIRASAAQKMAPEAAAESPPRLTDFDDDDRDNVLAFLLGMRPLNGVIFQGELPGQIEAGRRLIGKMASIHGVDSLTPAQCADVLLFVTSSESIEPLDWNSNESPHRVCGFMNVLRTVQKALRAMEAQS